MAAFGDKPPVRKFPESGVGPVGLGGDKDGKDAKDGKDGKDGKEDPRPVSTLKDEDGNKKQTTGALLQMQMQKLLAAKVSAAAGGQMGAQVGVGVGAVGAPGVGQGPAKTPAATQEQLLGLLAGMAKGNQAGKIGVGAGAGLPDGMFGDGGGAVPFAGLGGARGKAGAGAGIGVGVGAIGSLPGAAVQIATSGTPRRGLSAGIVTPAVAPPTQHLQGKELGLAGLFGLEQDDTLGMDRGEDGIMSLDDLFGGATQDRDPEAPSRVTSSSDGGNGSGPGRGAGGGGGAIPVGIPGSKSVTGLSLSSTSSIAASPPPSMPASAAALLAALPEPRFVADPNPLLPPGYQRPSTYMPVPPFALPDGVPRPPSIATGQAGFLDGIGRDVAAERIKERYLEESKGPAGTRGEATAGGNGGNGRSGGGDSGGAVGVGVGVGQGNGTGGAGQKLDATMGATVVASSGDPGESAGGVTSMEDDEQATNEFLDGLLDFSAMDDDGGDIWAT
ncbi:hypothetical protein M427DRAFT_53293 [Gonapodya prolifera JEL478]|uniref:Uncharacterized protein n=1 Tax=Gonapodya prolifera (strain JEL478) TaxID=1344416 RepID=A0A139APX6_GONPJ|nr:hypothetical protein M427DRAFT_53293 [Gonapodya prolifera JEL478]|eukprot:KXS18799.1 hypothetical protein M427DRAFT_53293 [Gonapodya prolifera JEL478]